MSGNHSIMIVDDEADILTLVEKYLQKLSYPIEAYHNPQKALEAFQSNPTHYSLVLTDVRMPYMSGIELAQKIKQLNPHVKIMLMTAFEISEEMLSGLSTIRRTEIVRKPFRLVDICESVKKQLQIAV